ncbi:MAG: T9SS type A sorting domain-containing protein, partial [Chitinophagales bacterium]|nr:T9SS type A sorting domain-containing protein [Chitinophagales bacterium]
IMSKNIQFYSANNVTVLDTVIHKQNIFGIDVNNNPIDLNATINFYDSKIAHSQFVYNEEYSARIRYRDNNLKWSEWSNNYLFIVNGLNEVTNSKMYLQNYPNPFKNETKIEYLLTQLTNVTLNIYALDHRLIYNLTKTNQPKGNYSILFNPTQLSSGVYFCNLITNNGSSTIKIIKSN